MRRATLQRKATSAVLPRLEAGEDVLGAAAVWVTTPRSRLQRFVSSRRLLPAAVTEHRLVLFRPPEKGEIDSGSVALEVPFSQLRLDGVGHLPLLQVRLRAGRTREIVVEFRLRDRGLGRELAGMVKDGVASRPASQPAPRPPTSGRRPAPPPASGPDR
ncbi:MAG: hypothetical protein ACRDWD_14340 [Acidimicrobiia bacterium]